MSAFWSPSRVPRPCFLQTHGLSSLACGLSPDTPVPAAGWLPVTSVCRTSNEHSPQAEGQSYLHKMHFLASLPYSLLFFTKSVFQLSLIVSILTSERMCMYCAVL